MAESPRTTVEIALEIPPCANPSSAASSIHRRSLEDVPQAVAREMLRDYAAYRAQRDEAEQHKLYKYRRLAQNGHNGTSHNGTPTEKAAVAIDFEEVISLEVLGPRANGHAEE